MRAAELPKKLFGYDVVERLGLGAGSTLYAVSDPATRQLYALKHVVKREEADTKFMRQLETEYQVGRQLTHPVLRKSIAIKFSRTLLFKVAESGLVLELFDGLPLIEQPPKPLREILRIFTQVARGLDSMHHLRLIHCDLKPSNILVNASGDVKVIDFGQACRAGLAKERIQGTPDFIAPEQVERKPITVRTDIFNFGATLYWALTGQKIPTLYTIRRSKREMLTDREIISPNEINALIAPELSQLVMDCIRIEPTRRPADLASVASRLEALRAGGASRGAQSA